MNVSDLIAGFISEMVEGSDGVFELQRSELAERFRCVPRQINYVLSTRFSPERGFLVESRRGGGGYIRITRVQMSDESAMLMHIVNAITDQIDYPISLAFLNNMLEEGLLSGREANLISAAISDKVLKSAPSEARDALRANILKHALISLG